MSEVMMKPELRVKSLWNTINNILFVLGLLVGLLLIIPTIGWGLFVALAVFWFLFVYVPFALYIPAAYRCLEYSLDDEALRMKKGVFWKRQTTVPYPKITNIDIVQGPVERMFKVCHLEIQTAGSSGNQAVKAELILVGIGDGEAVKEMIMNKLPKRNKPAEAVSSIPQTESYLLQAILSELGAIRTLLSNKN